MKEQQTGKATAMEGWCVDKWLFMSRSNDDTLALWPMACMHGSVFSLMYVISIKGYWTITKLDDGSPFVSWINGHALRLEWTQCCTEFAIKVLAK